MTTIFDILTQTYIDTNEINKLYSKGLDDFAIGEKLSMSSGAVREWRKLNSLASNSRGRPRTVSRTPKPVKLKDCKQPHTLIDACSVDKKEPTPIIKKHRVDFAPIEKYHKLGYSDSAISLETGAHVGTVENWRKRNQYKQGSLITLSMLKAQKKHDFVTLTSMIAPTKDPESLFYSESLVEIISKKKENN
jgi:transposase